MGSHPLQIAGERWLDDGIFETGRVWVGTNARERFHIPGGNVATKGRHQRRATVPSLYRDIAAAATSFAHPRREFAGRGHGQARFGRQIAQDTQQIGRGGFS